MSQLFQELKRRNVFRVAIAYLAVAWLILQAADIVLDNIDAPAWLMKAVMFFMVAGFPFAMIFAWAFEMTPDGIKKEAEVDRSASITQQTGKMLDRAIIGVLGVAVVFLLIDKFLPGESGLATSASSEKSVAVLPFVAMSRGPDDEYFADGLTEEVLNSLTRLPELLVTARTSAFHFKGQDLPVPEIAAALGVAHIVEGSVRRDGDRLRVTAQLIRASDGFHLWSENYDRETADTFRVQTDIAEKIAASLDVVMDDQRRERMRAVGLRDPQAFVAYQKGVEVFNQAHGSTDRQERLLVANALLEQALELEPGLSAAYWLHADYYTHFLMDNVANADVSDEQRAAAYASLEQDLKNAIRTAPDDSLRLAAAYDLAVISGDWRRLPALFDELVQSTGCAQSSWIDVTSLAYGKAQAYLSFEQRKIECDPLYYGGYSGVSAAYLYLGDIDAAIAIANNGMDRTPHIRIQQQLLIAQIAGGRFDEAEMLVQRDTLGDGGPDSLQLQILASRSDADALMIRAELSAQFENAESVGRLIFSATLGNRELSNTLAAGLDAARYGYLPLMLTATICRCGAPWDIEKTPNFARLLADAELSWPPASPVNWPLKDW